MARFQVAYNATTRVATVQPYSDVVTAGSVNIGNFYHDDALDPEGNLSGSGVADESHVIYHHVREILYKTKATRPAETGGSWPNNVTDMDKVTIVIDASMDVVSISTLPATVTLDLSAEETSQLVNTFTPTAATNQEVTYTTSDATKATVSASGLITPVAVGTATITVTTVDGAKTDTCAVTVVA